MMDAGATVMVVVIFDIAFFSMVEKDRWVDLELIRVRIFCIRLEVWLGWSCVGIRGHLIRCLR